MSTIYMHRLNVLQPTVTWKVDPDGLSWADDDGGMGYIPRDEIASVRLKFEPTRVAPKRVGLHFFTPKQYAVSNSHYKGVMNFEHKPEEFRQFVVAFHEMFRPNSATKFNQGSTKAGFIGNLILTFGILAFLLFLAPLISMMGIGSGGTNIFRIVMILIFLPLLFKSITKNRPRTYRPDKVPMNMLD